MRAASEPRVSILTPLYNNVEHLAECLDSILAQAYENWDCTIVNNCSTDGSADIAYRYAQRDSRIRVHDNPNFLSAIANHNEALRQASPISKYCKVVFADDWIFPECLDRMVSVAEEHPAVGIVGAHVLEGRNVTSKGLPRAQTVFSGRDICRRHLLDRVYVFGSANSLMYRADLVRNRDPFFNEANIHADNELCFALLKTCDFGFVHQVLTATRLREGSLNTKSLRMQTSMADWLQVLLEYGPVYLNQDELKSLLDQHLADYYRFLGKSALQDRGDEFWDFHRSKMIEAGVGFSRARVVRGMLATLWDAVLNPKRTAEAVIARRRKSVVGTRPTISGDRNAAVGEKEDSLRS
jgi:glycosyltransferase involved in cell wall biosynthesis